MPAKAAPPAGPSGNELVELARTRAVRVRDTLADDQAVPEECIYTCEHKPDQEDDGDPRVDIGV